MSTGADPLWPTDKLTALRIGQRLVAEVPASRPGRRAFVDITPVTTPADTQARLEGWKRTDYTRVFRLQHWDYDADLIDGWDYDVGAVMIRAADATGEGELLTTLRVWQLRPGQFLYPLADRRPEVVTRFRASKLIRGDVTRQLECDIGRGPASRWAGRDAST